MRTCKLGVCGVIAMAAGVTLIHGIAKAAPVGTLDQFQNNLTTTLYVDGDGGGRPRGGQSFTPTLPLLTDVELNIASVGGSIGPASQVRVEIFAAGGTPDSDGAGPQQGDGPIGPALGGKTFTIGSITVNALLDDLITFDTPIFVVPGTKYFIEVQTIQDGDAIDFVSLGANNNTDIYEQGRMVVLEGGVYGYHDGAASRDLQFRTYGMVPEPGTVGLIGLLALGMGRRLRCRN